MFKLKSVLLVDDDATVNFLNDRLFSRLQVAEQLQFAANGQEALDTLGQMCASAEPGCPALVLLDVNMPVMNGIEFLEHYQQLPAAIRSATVVVVLTTSELRLDMARIRQYPVGGILLKPLTEDKVNTLLREHFGLA
jgi:CheY-like chemotaxis protein